MSERFPLLLVEKDGVFNWEPMTDIDPAWAAVALLVTLDPDENKVYMATSVRGGVALEPEQVAEFAEWLITNVKRMSEEATA